MWSSNDQGAELTKQFGPLIAVDNINLEIKRGEIFGLVGPDGAGKTTLIRMILGVVEPNRGTVQVMGNSNVEDVKKLLGYIPQKFSLYRDLTVMENIRLIGSLYETEGASIESRAGEILSFTSSCRLQTGWPKTCPAV